MSSFVWMVAGLGFDFLGVLFLSAEAIGLDRLRGLQVRLVNQHNRSLAFEPPSGTSGRRKLLTRLPYVVVHYVAGSVIILLALLAMRQVGIDVLGWIGQLLASRSWNSRGLGLVVALLALGIVAVVSFFVGELFVHRPLKSLLSGVLDILSTITERSAAGSAGLIGFGFFSVGLTLQGVAAWLGR